MSDAAPAAVQRAAGALPPGPALLYDLERIAARMTRARAIAAACRVELLHAVKAFPPAAAVAMAAGHLDGLDLAGPDEQAAALAVPPTRVSVTWPGPVDGASVAALVAHHREVVVVCETVEQVAAAAAVPGAIVAVRLSVSGLLGDDVAGGVHDAAGRRVSRFGAAPAQLPALVAAGRGRVRAVHVHGGPLVTAPARLARLARAACHAAAAAGIELDLVDLGGSLHGFAIDRAASGVTRLADALAAARAEVPAAVALRFEPGRLWTEGAGFAAGRVIAARDLDGQAARVLDLSRLCHLRWSSPRLVAPPPRPGERAERLLLGATCCEDDVIGSYRVRAEDELAVGARVLLAGVSGYAAAWNRGFAGVPAARVVLVE